MLEKSYGQNFADKVFPAIDENIFLFFTVKSMTVLDIRDDLGATMNECREVTEKYRTGRSAYLRIGQLFMRLFAGLL